MMTEMQFRLESEALNKSKSQEQERSTKIEEVNDVKKKYQNIL